ncbi:MAG: quinone-dependent dihydroorotate dehydrogenase [Alphaproteobacteria bacterium]|jgi:dihydroorotate dehydrogenase
MNIYKNFFRPLAFSLEPETAHAIALHFIKKSISPLKGVYKSEKLEQKLLNLNFPNPIGLAAGFDKNAETGEKIFNFGFGFAEFGTVTPKAQIGNEKPRVFRDTENNALINSLGFPNEGLEAFIKNLKTSNKTIGINIGKNKDSEGLDDYLFLLEKLHNRGSYITINISSPNTPNLRNFLLPENLKVLLQEITNKKKSLNSKVPLFIKLSPDENDKSFEQTISIILNYEIDGIIISNTTTNKKNISSKYSNLKGGVSGKPLFERSNQLLSLAYKQTQNKIILIGVGGISSALDAYKKIKLGANLVQLYTGFVYEGFGLIETIKKDLVLLLEKDGLRNIKDLVGQEKNPA